MSDKRQLESLASEEPEAQAAQMELEEQVRIEQAKLNRLDNELDELDRAVTRAAFRPQSTPQ